MMAKQTEAARIRSSAQSFLLTLYPSRPHGKKPELLGTVERIGNEGRHTFHSIEELLYLLGIEGFKFRGQENEHTS